MERMTERVIESFDILGSSVTFTRTTKWKDVRSAFPASGGVYLLAVGNQIIYVGSTSGLQKRMYSHTNSRGGGRFFNRALWIEFPIEEARMAEGALIRYLTPKHNTVHQAPGEGGPEDLYGILVEMMEYIE
jgi:hypothetical protein